MTGTFLWGVLFFLLFFIGIFIMVLYTTRVQTKALGIILMQQKSMRLELDRLAGRLDNLLVDREVLTDDYLMTDTPIQIMSKTTGKINGNISGNQHGLAEDLTPGIEKLLLGEPSSTEKPYASGLPEIKI